MRQPKFEIRDFCRAFCFLVDLRESPKIKRPDFSFLNHGYDFFHIVEYSLIDVIQKSKEPCTLDSSWSVSSKRIYEISLFQTASAEEICLGMDSVIFRRKDRMASSVVRRNSKTVVSRKNEINCLYNSNI